MTTKTSSPKPGSLKHAAVKLGVSLPTVYKLINEGKLTTYHIGRAHRVSDAAIAACVELLESESARERAA